MKAEQPDKKFDEGEDITKYLDVSKAHRPEQEQRRVNVDFPVWMIYSLDKEAKAEEMPSERESNGSEAARALLRRVASDLEGAPLHEAPRGASNRVFCADADHVVRLPRAEKMREAVRASMALERRLLDRIAGRLALTTPQVVAVD